MKDRFDPDRVFSFGYALADRGLNRLRGSRP